MKIYIDRLKDGRTEKIEEVMTPDFLDVHEAELTFSDPVSFSGDAYLTDDHLIIRLEIKTLAQIPCSICNHSVTVPIEIKDFYTAEPIKEITSACFDCSEILRESILLQVPAFAECDGGKCPERQNIKNFLKQPEDKPELFPFKSL